MMLQQLKDRLLELNATVAAAESLTTGRVQSRLGALSGSSQVYEGGVTAYSIDQKVKLLGVDREHAASVNCVSAKVAEQMAHGVRRLFDTDFAVATTGYAETPGDTRFSEPTAFLAVVSAAGCVHAEQVSGKGLNRIEMQDRVARRAIEALLEHVKSL